MYQLDATLKKSVLDAIRSQATCGEKDGKLFTKTLVSIFLKEQDKLHNLACVAYGYIMAITIYKDEAMGETLAKSCQSENALGFMIKKVILTESLRGNREAIALLAFIYYDTHSDEVEKIAVGALLKTSTKKDLKVFVVEAIKKYDKYNHLERLQLLAQIDLEDTFKTAKEWILGKDGDNIEYALCVASSVDLSGVQITEFISACNFRKNKLINTDSDRRGYYYELLRKGLQKKALSPETVRESALKALTYEDGQRGLRKLWELLKKVDKNPMPQFLEAILKMIQRDRGSSQNYINFLEDIISHLPHQEKITFLSQALISSGDSHLLWEFGQKLIALTKDDEIQRTKDVFLKVLASKKSAETTAQFLARIRDREEGFKRLQGVRKEHIAPITEALIESLSKKLDSEIEIIICDEMIQHGPVTDYPKIISCLERIALTSSDDRQGKAIKLLLACQARKSTKEIRKHANEIIESAMLLDRKKVISIMEKLAKEDTRTYLMEPLTPIAINFLARKPETDRVNAIGMIFNGKTESSGDIRMNYSSVSLGHLTRFAIEGSTIAANAIIRKNGAGIWNEAIPAALISIFDKTANEAVRSMVVEGAAKRFKQSFSKDDGRDERLSLYYEIAAIKHFRKEPAIREAFLHCLDQIGKSDYLEDGLATIIEETPFILKDGARTQARNALIKLANKLTLLIEKPRIGYRCEETTEQRLLEETNKTILKLV